MIKKSFLLLLFLSQTAFAETTNPLGQDPRPWLKYADYLADEGDFYRAISEYKKVLFFFPNYEKRDWIYLQIGRMYYAGGRYEQAKDVLVPLTATSDRRLLFFTRNFLALTYYENGDFVSSYRLFSELAEESSGDDVFDYGIYQGMSLVQQKNFVAAQDVFTRYRRIAMPHEHLAFFERAVEISREGAGLHEVSKTWATVFAVLFPGGGHAYLGQWDNALVSFLIVASTGFLAYDGFRRDNPVQAGIFTTFSSGFYVGSIYSAHNQAGKLNAQLGESQIQSLNQEFKKLTLRLDKAVSF